LRVYLTIPVKAAPGERSLSKLSKTYLRSENSQERLHNLAWLSIETGIVKIIDFKYIQRL